MLKNHEEVILTMTLISFKEKEYITYGELCDRVDTLFSITYPCHTFIEASKVKEKAREMLAIKKQGPLKKRNFLKLWGGV